MKHKEPNEVLDEMQDHKLLKLQEYGFWLMFWVLFAAILIQLLFGAALKDVIGEAAALFAGSLYLAVAAIRNGLWTRTAVPTTRANASVSAIPALLIAGFHAMRLFLIAGRPFRIEAAAAILLLAAVTYVLCFLLLEVLRLLYVRRRNALDDVGRGSADEPPPPGKGGDNDEAQMDRKI